MPLTPMESIVMELWDRGVDPLQISFRLEIKLKTVERTIKYYGSDSRQRDRDAMMRGSARLRDAIAQSKSTPA